MGYRVISGAGQRASVEDIHSMGSGYNTQSFVTTGTQVCLARSPIVDCAVPSWLSQIYCKIQSVFHFLFFLSGVCRFAQYIIR